MRTLKNRCSPLAWIAWLLILLGIILPLRAQETVQPLAESIGPVAAGPKKTASDFHTPYVSRATLSATEEDAEIEFEVVLKMRDLAGLRDRNGRHDRVSAADMTAQFTPLDANYNKVVDWLKREGFQITAQGKNHLAVFARGKVSLIKKALRTNFARVAFEGSDYTSSISAPQVPTSLAPLLVGINGLQQHVQMHKNLVLNPNNASGPNPPYLPNQVAQAYKAYNLYQSNITGAGQSIAIVIDTFPAASDLQSFWTTYGVNQNINNISFIQVISGTLPSPSGEETLDTQWASSLAPGSKVRVYATKTLAFTAIDQAYQQIYNDAVNHPEYNIHQVSMSYGLGETYVSTSQLNTDSQYYALLVSAGITLYCSSGDAGATPDDTGHSGGGPLQVEIPSSDPNVTSVGGTTLILGTGNVISSETVWNNYTGATGGGVSAVFARPSWQVGASILAGAKRLVPDISCTADPVYGGVVILNGAVKVYGGTSWSSPCWAAFNALFNQNRAAHGLAPIGLITPYLYPLLGTSNFGDVTSGNNKFGSTSGYNAGVGYDDATGIGVPNVQLLAQSLLSPAGIPVFSDGPPPSVAGVGVPYSFTFTTYQSGATFSLLSGTLPTGLSLTSAGLLSGTPTALGSFTATVRASNGSGTASQTFTINVQQLTAPTITSSPPPAAVYGTPYSFSYTATGAPAPTFSLGAGTIPPGLTLTSAGVLAGTPTVSGIFSGSVRASNGVGSFASQSFSITVRRAPVFFSSPLITTTTQGASFSATFSYTAYPSPTFSITQGSLPPGININTATGTLSGTSTAAGVYTGTITASNGVSPNGTLTFTITVNAPTPPAFLQPSLSLVTTLSSTLNFTDKVTGSPAPTLTVASGSLPPGLTLSSAGVLSGTTTKVGIYSGVIAAQNGAGTGISQPFTITVLRNFVSGYTTLHSFGGGGTPADGSAPQSPLVQAPDGNFYGTVATSAGGSIGAVFRITPQGAYTIIHTFQDGSVANDGHWAVGGVIVGADGNLYGTTVAGGVFNSGTIFKMTTNGVETILYHFPGGAGGDGPFSSLVQGQDGSLYGTTYDGGTSNNGTIFKCTLQGSVTILHSFAGSPGDGRVGFNSLVVGPDQNLYGTTPLGGSASGGVLFMVTPQGAYSVLHHFGDGSVPNDGTSPKALVVGSDGTLYGIAYGGGAASYGIAYKMTLAGVETILHNFNDGSTANDGYGLDSGLYQADDGNFYGGSAGGGPQNTGTLFRMNPQGAVTNLHVFGGLPEGQEAYAPPIKGMDGSFYGTTLYGGTYADGSPRGTVYKLSLIAPPAITSAAATNFTVGAAGAFTVTASGGPVFSATGLPAWAALDSSTGVLSGTPPFGAASPITVNITATNGVGPDAQQALTINLQTTFPQWQTFYFGSPANANAAASATPQNDGVPNLLKYVYGIAPTGPMTAADRAALPVLGLDSTSTPGSTYLALTYRQNAVMSGVTINVQTSTDLQTWTTVTPPDLSKQIGVDPTTGDPILEVGVITAGEARKFIRLNVTQP